MAPVPINPFVHCIIRIRGTALIMTVINLIIAIMIVMMVMLLLLRGDYHYQY
jgi:hypothetical protein